MSNPALLTTFTAASQVGPVIDCAEFSNLSLFFQPNPTLNGGVYATGLSVVLEVSHDGVNFDTVHAVRAGLRAATSTVMLSASAANAYDVCIGGFRYFRARSSTWASPAGGCDLLWAGTQEAYEPSVAATINGTVTTTAAGSNAHSSATFGNPVPTGGQAKSTVDTTLVDGDTCAQTYTSARQLVMKKYGSAELDFQYTGIITTTTQTAIKAAGAANVRNYLTDLDLQNTSATPTTVLIQDGATTIWQTSLPASMATPLKVVFDTPKRGSGATALNITCGSAANVIVNAGGFQNF